MPVKKRVVVHFSGFEPLSTEDHFNRYQRSAQQTAAVWDARFDLSPLQDRRFTVTGEGAGWRTESVIHLFDHNALIRSLRGCGPAVEIARGFRAFGAAAFVEGGLWSFIRAAWRFSVFFVFPFLYMAACLALMTAVALLPVLLGLSALHLLWSVPIGLLLFRQVLLPLMERLHTRALFANWQMAVKVARENDALFNGWIETHVEALKAAFAEEADEYLITSHSMGSNLAVQVVGKILEREPGFFAGRKVIFATLGGAALQCALLKCAGPMRRRVRLIAECEAITWIDVQSLTDIINFYKAEVPAACGHRDVAQPHLIRLRFKHVLSAEHYRRIKRDFLRVHRQYVLGPSRRGNFDFTLFTAGPFEAMEFTGFTDDRLPDLARFERLETAA